MGRVDWLRRTKKIRYSSMIIDRHSLSEASLSRMSGKKTALFVREVPRGGAKKSIPSNINWLCIPSPCNSPSNSVLTLSHFAKSYDLIPKPALSHSIINLLCRHLKHPLVWTQVTMRLSTFATALFAALATTAPAPVAVDESILNFLRDLPAGGPTLHKRYAYTFLFINGAIYANPTDTNLLAKVTTRCYVPAQDLLLLFTNGQKCRGPLVPAAAWFFGMSIDGAFFLVQPLFFVDEYQSLMILYLAV